MMRLWVYLMVSWFCLALLSGCASQSVRGPGDAGGHGGDYSTGRPAPWVAAAIAGDGPGRRAVAASPNVWRVQNLPKSRRGNPTEYNVHGERYAVLDSAEGFVERGHASWYGRKFHGRETSSGEVYDMYQMTAAHKHLPIPTFARVTRTDTGASIIVKVNDRGPFVPGRVIDLSYQAAASLDMLESGTAPVVVEALSTHLPEGSRVAATTPAATASTVTPVVASTAITVPATPVETTGAASVAVNRLRPAAPEFVSGHYLQLAAFSRVDNAQRFIGKFSPVSPKPLLVNHDVNRSLYRVWVGPFASAEEHRAAVTALQNHGVENFTMVLSGR